MFSHATEFQFSGYHLSKELNEISFQYLVKFHDSSFLPFTEKVLLPDKPNWDTVPTALLTTVLESLHLILGISYWKMYIPKKISFKSISLTKKQAEFWNTIYKKGLGEFFYRNRIDQYDNLINFPYQSIVKNQSVSFPRQNRSLVAVGGGKDSIVAIEMLKKKNLPITGIVVETGKTYPLINEVIKKTGINSLTIKRIPDPKLFKINKKINIYKGHIPISAVYAFLDLLAAVIYNYRQIIFSNEKSSDEANVKLNNQLINHQWSKTSEFELLFQTYVKENITADVNYFSLLRPWYELRISQQFATYPQYWPIFSSCNRNFSLTKVPPENRWCGQCPKCASVFLLLAPFIDKDRLLKIFSKNLFEDEKLIPVYKQLLGLEGVKPFECVATIEESRLALLLVYEKKQFLANPIINIFKKEVLPKLKNIPLLMKKILSTGNLDNLPDQFKLLMCKKVLILGYGKEGKATEKFLKVKFPEIEIGIADKNISADYLKKQKDYDLVIKTPGIKKELVTTSYTTATNLFFSGVNNLIIGVTGSKGKSTTASLIHHILKTAGKPVQLIGNIGYPALELLSKPIKTDDIFVMELSSYQLDDIHYSPQIAVITNLFPEHMTYHGDVNKYFLAKKNILLFQKPIDYFIYNPKNNILSGWKEQAISQSIAFRPMLTIDQKQIPLLGKHNQDNIRAAITIAHLLKITDQTIIKAINTFKPLPHRLEFVGEFNGIKFFDDAISTAPESTIAAIKTLDKIGTIFLGGEDRGYDFNLLVKILAQSHIPNFVLFPDTGAKIYQLIIKQSHFQPKVLQTTSMEEAVKFAYQYTPKNFICLLSTASPSYSLWKNFEEKGDQFKLFVRKLAKPRL